MRSRGVWESLRKWYAEHGRDLPWRVLPGASRRVSDYRVVVSEFMLQQTQVDRVVPLFKRFLKRFPTWRALAEAPQAEVVRAWKGLGYNLRAARLKNLAAQVLAEFGGRLPPERERLLALKGIGPYTARALQAFVHRADVLAPDTNVRRVLARVHRGPAADPAAFDEAEWRAWESKLPRGSGYDLNQALMDLGARACTAARPKCEVCPLKRQCASYPEILSLARLPRQKAPRRERVDADGVPNRIYRGRVIEALREGPLPAARLDALGRRVRPSYAASERPWLLGVLAGLEKDGLVRNAGTRWVLA